MTEPAPAAPAIRFDGLGFAYRRGDWLFRYYDGVVPRGEVMAVLGPNGCGKTTLLRLLLGLAKPTEGRVIVNGTIGFVPQLFQAGFDYSVLDMVLMGRERHVGLLAQPSRADEDAAHDALATFGLADLASRSFHQLSGGQRQLVIFARALVARADVLLLDEPASALDLSNQALILDWIGKLAHHNALTVVFTTHHPHHALAVASRVLMMMEQTCLLGPAAAILTEQNLERLYGVPIRRLTVPHGGRMIETLVPILAPVHH